MVAAVFALHPVHVESVAWMTELKNTLSGVFYLAAALCWIRFDECRSRRTYMGSLMFFGLTSDVGFKKIEFKNQGDVLDRFGFDNLIVSQAEEVPEPASLTLLASGLLCVGGVWRTRRKSGAGL